MSEVKRIVKERKRIEAKERSLKRLRGEIAQLIKDASIRFGLPQNKTSKQLLTLLRKFHRIKRHECYYCGRREPLPHTELYEIYKEQVEKWTVGDVNELIDSLRYHMKQTKEKAIAKIIVDHAYAYILLYEHCMNIPNNFETFTDKKKGLMSIPKSMILTFPEGEKSGY